MSEILEQMQADTRTAMKAGEKPRVQTLRMLVSAVQQDVKEGAGDPVAVLQRERKKRLEAAEAFAEGGRAEQAAAEQDEAALIEGYLPAQLDDAELAGIVAAAIEETGADSPKQMGQVMGAVMPRVKGLADGGRVSAAVREQLGS